MTSPVTPKTATIERVDALPGTVARKGPPPLWAEMAKALNEKYEGWLSTTVADEKTAIGLASILRYYARKAKTVTLEFRRRVQADGSYTVYARLVRKNKAAGGNDG